MTENKKERHWEIFADGEKSPNGSINILFLHKTKDVKQIKEMHLIKEREEKTAAEIATTSSSLSFC